ncbi:MAG: MBOAT family O-acyltransferase [Devosia sp.]
MRSPPFAAIAWALSLAFIAAVELADHSAWLGNSAYLGQFGLRAAIPAVICVPLVALLIWLQRQRPKFDLKLQYALFFAISVTSALGLTKTLTGSHAGSGNPLLYGLSFYTATLAYHYAKGNIGPQSALVASNPLLLVTGPIATFFRNGRHRALRSRFAYYFPFLILGLFFYQMVATPLTQTFFLLNDTDAASSISFAIIFEMFVYANFCGLSLIVFAVMGIVGVKIPLNFRQPFSATNLVDFWKGWHTSLSAVLKALFYDPVRGRYGRIAAVFAVYLSSAMWHGVSMNFLIWGLFHAALFAISVELLKRRIPVVPVLLMIFGVVIGRLMFADADFGRLLSKLTFHVDGMGDVPRLLATPRGTREALLLIVAMIGAEFLFQKTRLFRQRRYKFYRLPWVQLVLLLIMALTITRDAGIEFAVYGQR